ncbi:MAG: site-2 protease family protein [Hellea sp.]|nr:site-2 protease family protein [Hellea sp.]
MLSLILTALIFVISFVLVISFLVFFHELGHYSVGRFFGVAVERFSIGFGKPIFRRKAKSGTDWVIGRYPLGGYVKFLGDAGAASNPDAQRLAEIKSELSDQGQSEKISDVFHFKPVWQRTLIVLAGPIANFILAIILFAILALSFGTAENESVVTELTPGGAAEKAGMEIGDHILTLNGKDVSLTNDLIPYVAIRSGAELDAIILRDGQEINLTLTPERKARRDDIGGVNNIGTIGVNVGGREFVRYIDHGPISALNFGYDQFTGMIATTGSYVGRIFQGKEDGKAFGGPVKIATITGKSVVDIVNDELTLGQKLRNVFATLLSLSAAISIGLGVANLMPIPALDGGHLLYYGYEAIAGRPLSENKQEIGFRIGFAILVTLLIYFTINDFGYVRSMTS